MPQFKHRLTNEIREWRTDNEEVFRRLHKLGWRQVEDEQPVENEQKIISLNEEIPDAVMIMLGRAGLTDLDAVRSASDERILAIDGIGRATLRKIREALS